MPRPAVLFVAPYAPFPVTHGGCMAIFHRLAALHDEVDFHLLCPAPAAAIQRAAAAEALGGITRTVTFYDPAPDAGERGRLRGTLDFCADAFLRAQPLAARQARGPGLRAALRGILARESITHVVAEHIYTLSLWEPADIPVGLPVSVIEQNVEHFIWRDAATNPHMSAPRRWASAWESAKLRRFAKARYPGLHSVLFISAADRAHFAAQGWNRRLHAANVILPVPPEAKGEFQATRRLMFTGTLGYYPNEEGLEWFAREVFPRLLARVPEARLVVGGETSPVVRAALGSQPQAELLGARPFAELDATMRACDVFISPIRLGSGIKMKNILALSHGMPLVGTTSSLRGIGVSDGREALIRDHPEEFAAAVAQVLTCPDAEREGMSRQARAYFMEQHAAPGALGAWRRFFATEAPEA